LKLVFNDERSVGWLKTCYSEIHSFCTTGLMDSKSIKPRTQQ